MMDATHLIHILALVLAATPVALVAVLGLASLFDSPLPERATSRLSFITILVGLLAALGITGGMIAQGDPHITVSLADWIVIPHYHFSLKLLFDVPSLAFVVLTFVLCGTICRFASHYLHREPGFNRFFFAYALFVLGMVLTVLAGTIETLFFGWELVGLSSALLVAFFQERQAPVRNGLRVWIVYRVSDAALLAAAVALHHLRGEGDFDTLLGPNAWPGEIASITPNQALGVGLLLLLAAAGKSALVPFSGWLPRSMEGPTPSSAVFYGALSVHLGAYLLLRVSPIIELSIWLSAIIVAVGLVTAISAALIARVQTDIKCALTYASLTQVGLIVAEIGLGLHWIPLIHMLGHAFVRTLQFLRAPSLLQDYKLLENALGKRLPNATPLGSPMPAHWKLRLYRLALMRGYWDAWLGDYIVAPFLAVFRWCDRAEQAWTHLISGQDARNADVPTAVPDLAEELS